MTEDLHVALALTRDSLSFVVKKLDSLERRMRRVEDEHCLDHHVPEEDQVKLEDTACAKQCNVCEEEEEEDGDG